MQKKENPLSEEQDNATESTDSALPEIKAGKLPKKPKAVHKAKERNLFAGTMNIEEDSTETELPEVQMKSDSSRCQASFRNSTR